MAINHGGRDNTADDRLGPNPETRGYGSYSLVGDKHGNLRGLNVIVDRVREVRVGHQITYDTPTVSIFASPEQYGHAYPR